MTDDESTERRKSRSRSRGEADDPRGGKWILHTLLAAAGLAAALGMAWYAVEGYRQSGPGAGSAGPAAEDADARGTGSSPRGGVRARRSSGRSRWLSVRAPVVTFPTLSGDTASLAGHGGEAVVLNFWATWCPPCKEEIPELARLQDSLRSEHATVVGVAVSSGTREEIRTFGEEYGINYPIWLSDPGTAATEYGALGLPLTLLVDRRGVIRRRYMGPQTYETLRRDLRALMDSTPAGPGTSRAGTSSPSG